MLISAFLFPSQTFRQDIEPTSISNGIEALKDWAEQRFDDNYEFSSSQLMDFYSEDIEVEDDYVALSLEQMMDSYPSKKNEDRSIAKERPNKHEVIEVSLEQEIRAVSTHFELAKSTHFSE